MKKGVNAVKYNKPEISTIGRADQVIEIVNNHKTSPLMDGSVYTNPAYDLDE
jgi:hypothetical protein